MSKKSLVSVALTMALLAVALPASAKDFLYVPGPNLLQVIDCDTDTVVDTVSYDGFIVNATPSQDGKRYYMNNWRTIYVVDTQTNRLIDKHEFWSDLNRVYVMPGIAVSLDGNYLYLSLVVAKKKLNVPRLNVLPPQFAVYDLKKKQIVRSFDIPPCCNAVVPLRDDPDHVILMAQDIYKLNVKDGKMTKIKGVLHPEDGQPGLNSLVVWNNWSPGDHGIFVNGVYSTDGNLFYMLIDKKGSLSLLKGEDTLMVYSSVISPDKKYVYSAMDEVYKVDLQSGKTLASDLIERGTCYAVAITADGKKLYVGPAGPDITVYDTSTMKPQGKIALKTDGCVTHRISK
ncbi:MAG: hypothetical protein AB1640_00455 [bacterium]